LVLIACPSKLLQLCEKNKKRSAFIQRTAIPPLPTAHYPQPLENNSQFRHFSGLQTVGYDNYSVG
jgi:hypothetical protein